LKPQATVNLEGLKDTNPISMSKI